MVLFDSVVANLVEEGKENLLSEMNQISVITIEHNKRSYSYGITCLKQLESQEDGLKALKSALMMIYIEENDQTSALNMLQSGAGTNFYYHDHKPIHHAALFKMQKVITALLDSGIQVEDDSCIISILQENDDDRDSWREIVDMLVENLFKLPDAIATSSLLRKLIDWKCTSATEVMKRVSTLKMDLIRFPSDFFLDTDILGCELECFKIFLEKFGQILLDFIIDVNGDLNGSWFMFSIHKAYCARTKDELKIFENINYLMNWQHSDKIVQATKKFTADTRTCFCFMILNFCDASDISSEQMHKVLECVMKAGIKLTPPDMDCLYAVYGYNSVFKQLLLKPIKLDVQMFYGTFSAFYYDLTWNIERLASSIDENSKLIPRFGILFFYFAHPVVKKCAKCNICPYLRDLAENSADFPKLVELARNLCRKNIIETYGIQDTKQFYKLIGNLPIANVYKEILLLERRLY